MLKKLLLTMCVALLAYILLAIVMHNLGITKGYKYINHQRDYSLIKRFSKTIIGANVISVDRSGDYIVGLRIPAFVLSCGGSNFVKMFDEKRYFILDTSTGEVFDYHSNQHFQDELEKRSILDKVDLDYSAFESIPKQYSTHYGGRIYKRCTVDLTPML